MKIMQVITDYIMKSILTTQGDMVVRGASVPEKLAAVAVNQVLKSAGVGAKPAWGVPFLKGGYHTSGGFQQSTDGARAVTGVGFSPTIIFFLSGDATYTNNNWSVGIDDGTDAKGLMCIENGAGTTVSLVDSITMRRSAANNIIGHVTAIGADGFTITFVLTGASIVNVYWYAIG